VATVTVNPAPTYGISLNPAGEKVFDPAIVGYGAQTAHSVTVNNTGNQTTGTLSIDLSGTNPTSFTLNKTTIPSIAANGNDSFTVTPNIGLAVGTYMATVTVLGGANITSRTFNVSFTVTPEPTFGIKLGEVADKDFDSAFEGYGPQTPHNVTVSNTGNQATGNLSIALSGANPTSFTLNKTSIPNIAVSGDDSFTVTPITGLTGGTYTASVTVTGANGISELMSVSFTVIASTYSISLGGATDFGSAPISYDAKTPSIVTVNNTGNQPTGVLDIILSGLNSSSFTLNKSSIANITVGGSDNFTVTPKTGLGVGIHEAIVTVSGANGISEFINVNFEVIALAVYGISINPSTDKNFGSVTVGYGAQAPHNVTINNTGDQTTGALSIALTGTNSTSFTLNKTSITNIAVGGSDNFTATPNIGLAEGTYTATVTVSGVNVTSQSFNVSFTVTPAAVAPTITTVTLPEGTVEIDYNATLSATGETPITWSLVGSLPNGLVLSDAGVISGTPTTTGKYSFTVKATNIAGEAVKELDIVINSQVVSATPTFPSDKNEVADKTGLNPDDLEERDGKVYLKKNVAERIAKELLKVDAVDTYILPVFEAIVTPVGYVAEIKYTIKGKDLLATYPHDINLIGMISPTTGKLLGYVDNEADFDDGKFTLLFGGVIFDGEIDPEGTYELTIYIRDGGEFDLDGIVNGKIISSLFIASEKTGSGKKGGGGCNAGYGYLAFAILGAVPFVLKKGK
jgi:hypothetical protein